MDFPQSAFPRRTLAAFSLGASAYTIHETHIRPHVLNFHDRSHIFNTGLAAFFSIRYVKIHGLATCPSAFPTHSDGSFPSSIFTGVRRGIGALNFGRISFINIFRVRIVFLSFYIGFRET